MYVFIVQTAHFSENTAMVEVRGVFQHMHQAMDYATHLRASEPVAPKITRHTVVEGPAARPVLTFGKPVPAFPSMEGGQTSVDSGGDRAHA